MRWIHNERDNRKNVQKFQMKTTKTTKTTKKTFAKCDFENSFLNRNEKIIKTWNVQKYRVISYKKKTFFSTNFWTCMRNSLIINTNTRKNMKKRFRIFVRNLIAKHESWYLQINDIINHLKVFEIRKFWNKLIKMKKWFNDLNFWSK